MKNEELYVRVAGLMNDIDETHVSFAKSLCSIHAVTQHQIKLLHLIMSLPDNDERRQAIERVGGLIHRIDEGDLSSLLQQALAKIESAHERVQALLADAQRLLNNPPESAGEE